ncbi:MrcB family domain-containing protein [Novosphingobium sp. KN65.2]|uniref:MrcB family domain-containing protein n=1 Tax=Novosphingobium sp. KN65.2 TaxID=1478134 RepID=UPI0005E48A26|nr:DUF3578 domain-containing protein [Novosphingobium sp. KN65.2]CDO38220.1 conserved hypothetical protein [Novosphingobium sp. KN65.2]
MRELFSEVLALQLEYSSENTPAMARRGDLIRNIIPTEMRDWAAAAPGALLPFRGRLNVQGRDGTGLKTFVPWVRIHSPELSPSAQSGWYVVYLFREDGSGVTLGISHGSTRFDGGDFKPRSATEAASLMRWGRGLLGDEASLLGFNEGVDLGSAQKLSRAYEATTAFSKLYPTNDLPSDETLQRDAENAVGLLGQIYRAIELGRSPEADPPEIAEAREAITTIARPKSPSARLSGQGFGLTAAQKQAVEARAMAMAYSWLQANGFDNIKDVHQTHSCDYLARRDNVEHCIEVKGTTAALGKVLLTANEVELHRKSYPHNVLIVVHDINLLDLRTIADGGVVTAFEQWSVAEAQLVPLSYSCILSILE